MITANFSGMSADETLVLSTGLWQYDTGQKLRISGVSGLSETTEVHFGIMKTDRAIVKTGGFDSQSNVLTVDIPNRFLELSDEIFGQIWVYIRESDTSAYTIRKIRIPIRKRKRPDDYVSPEDIPGKTQIETIVETYLEEHPSSINTVGMDNLSQNLKQSLALSTITSRNLLCTDMEQGKLFSTNGRNWNADSCTRSADFTPVEALTQYTFSRSESGYALAVFLYDNEKNMVSMIGMGANYTNTTFITPAGAAFLRFYSLSDSFEILYQLERGDSATEYQSPDFSETKMQLNENYMSGKTVQRLTPKMTDIYVSASFAQNEDGYGVTKFNTIYAANESITDNSEKNRYTIHVADGTYTDLQERYSGIDDSEREATNYCGIVCKDYVYYEGNVQNPANCVISWDGKTGFSGDIVYSNVSKKAPFHLSKIVRNSLHTHIKGFTFNCKNLRYCLHIETSGAGREIDWLIEQCVFLWGGNPDCTDITGLGSKAALGCGHSPLEHGRFKNCTVNASNGCAYLCHDNSNGTTRTSGILSGADIRFENCNLSNGTIQCMSVKGDGLVDTPYVLSFDDCINIGSVALAISAPATQSAWKVEKGEEKAVKSNTYTKAETEQLITHSASLKESLSKKVTEITANSTNAQYPSALAVYNAIQTAIGGVENGSY